MRAFTEEQVLFRASYRKFLESEIVPHMARWREQGIVDRSAYEAAGRQGMLMLWPDKKYGGIGDNDFRFEQVIIEEIARADVGEFYAPLPSRLVVPYFKLGTEE
ncbi:acyl-CoA dehydrogenase family protein [Novosphingobium olei]|uniref:acyl-CoA dehydrogenase family protein n=1 Tax=Novosphingobium olei TaxID=2728851 RepID=UPI0019819FBE|nr:acyl-CoA dehydrogenase family protein [Novosphingobium olei]